MRPVLNVLSKFSLIHAIAQDALTQPDVTDEGREAYRRLVDTSFMALMKWPGAKITKKAIRQINDHLSEFIVRVGWENKPKHIQTYINFSLMQLEGVREQVKDKHRKRLVEDVIDAAMEVYRVYSNGLEKEIPLCMYSGLRASQVWDEVFSGEGTR